MAHTIRTFGDPVLRTPCAPVTDIDDTVVRLAQDMIDTMYAYRGVGVAAPQVGVSKAMFVYDAGDGPHTLINPRIVETSGEWVYDEGCLSVPGMFFPIKRPDSVVIEGVDLDGNEQRHETNELLGRIFQHETDHLEGRLLLSCLEADQRKSAMRQLRERQIRQGS